MDIISKMVKKQIMFMPYIVRPPTIFSESKFVAIFNPLLKNLLFEQNCKG
jgi:hypothetical protein